MPAIIQGDHAAAAFDSCEQFVSSTASFTRQALRARGHVAIFPGIRTQPAIAALTADPEIGPAVASGQVAFGDSRQVQLGGGGFDPDRLRQVYAAATEQALSGGFAGLWVSVDMTWAAPPVAAPADLVAFEAASHPLFDGDGLTAICQYDTAVFTAGHTCAALAAHPTGLVGSRLTHRRAGRTLTVRGETDLSNQGAFEALLADLTSTDLVDLTEMDFLDVAAVRTLARVAASHPRLRLRVSGMHQHLLTVLGVAWRQLGS